MTFDNLPSYPSPGESAGFDAEVAALAAAIHVSHDHPNLPGCLDMDRESASALLAALDGWHLRPDDDDLAYEAGKEDGAHEARADAVPDAERLRRIETVARALVEGPHIAAGPNVKRLFAALRAALAPETPR